MNSEIDYNNAPYNTINAPNTSNILNRSEDSSYNPLQSLVNSYLNPKVPVKTGADVINNIQETLK